MTTEEIKKEIEEIGSIRRTCPYCHERMRVKPSRVTCPKCGKPFYRKPEGKKLEEKVIVTIKEPVVSKKPKDIEVKKREISKDVSSELFSILSKRGANAVALINSDGIHILKGSATAPNWVTSTPEPVKIKGKELRDAGIIIDDKFTTDYTLKSPSMAAAIVMGRSANGLREWRNKEGKTLKELRGK